MPKNKHSLAIVLAVIQALSFTLMGVWVRMMSESFTVYQQAFWRFMAAAVTCWIIFGFKFKRSTFRAISPRDWFVYILRSFLNYGVGVILFTVAVLHADIAQVSFISSLPIAGLLAWLMFREKLDPKSLPFILISIIGLALVSGLTPSSFSITVGTATAIISMIGFSVAYLMVRYHPKSLSNFHNTTLMLSFAWIPPLALLIATRQPVIPSSLSTVALVGFTASVILNISGLYMLNFIFSNLKAYVAGNVLLLEGVFAFIIGYLLYGEKLSSTEMVGAVIIVLCAVILSRISLKQEVSL